MARVRQRIGATSVKTVRALRVGARRVRTKLNDLSFRLDHVLGDITRVIKRDLRRPQFFVMLMISVICIYAHSNNLISTTVSKWLNDRGANGLATWLTTHEKQLVGSAIFLPGLWALPRDYIVLAAPIIAGWIWMIPHPTIWEFSIQASIFHLFFSCQHASTKAILIGAGAGLYGIGWLTLLHTPQHTDQKFTTGTGGTTYNHPSANTSKLKP